MKATQASSTAKVIAASTILLASDVRTAAQVAPGAALLCQKLLSGSRADRWLASSAAHPWTRALWCWLERHTLPGIMAHYWHRKRWIESRCRQAFAEGFGRVIVIGAGLDTLGLRLTAEMPQIEVIEIDHPATQDAKRRALAGSAIAPPANLRFVACDLAAAPLPAALFDSDKPTVVIAEGVLMYLSPTEIAKLFLDLHGLSRVRIRMLFSFMTLWPDGRAGFRPHSQLIEHWLALRHEPFTWALAPEDMPDFLAGHRFRLVELALTRQFADHPTAMPSTLEGENLVVCESM